MKDTWEKYALNLAYEVANRSEDPHRKVGAVALNSGNQVIGCGYNGTPSGFLMPDSLLNDREGKRMYMIHAEMNLCSLIKKNDANLVAITCSPCKYCFVNLISHGVKRVVYKEDYPDDDTLKIYQLYSSHIKLEKIV